MHKIKIHIIYVKTDYTPYIAAHKTLLCILIYEYNQCFLKKV